MRVTGRSKFKKFKVIITILKNIFNLLGYKGNVLLYSFFKNTDGTIGILMRYLFLSNIVKKIGDNVSIQPYCVIKNFKNLEIGDNVSIHSFCYIEAIGGISIGNDVSIAHSSTLISSNHTWLDNNIAIKYNKEVAEKIIIDDDVWIGCGVRILAGVNVASRCVVAAGAVVNKNVVAKSLVGGVPAKILKSI